MKLHFYALLSVILGTIVDFLSVTKCANSFVYNLNISIYTRLRVVEIKFLKCSFRSIVLFFPRLQLRPVNVFRVDWQPY